MLINSVEDLLNNKAFDVSSVNRLISDVSEVLNEERRRHDGLINIRQPQSPFLVVGDLHGDLRSLMFILKFAERSGIHNMVFLGDYVDRGENQVETLLTVLYIKLRYPEDVFLLRGNHEPPEFLPVYPHDFPVELRHRYGAIHGIRLYSRLKEVFQLMPHALIFGNTALLLHGGPPTHNIRNSSTVSEYLIGGDEAERLKILEEVLWNDPTEDVPYVRPSYRGAGYLFGHKITESALSITKTAVVVRGHEPCLEGFKTNHGGKVITIFSRLGPPYYNTHASFMILTPNSTPEELASDKSVIKFTSEGI